MPVSLTQTSTSSTSSIAKQASTANGNLLIVSASNTTGTAITGPAGWGIATTVSTTGLYLRIFTRVVSSAASEPATYTFTNATVLMMRRFSLPNLTNPVTVVETDVASTGSFSIANYQTTQPGNMAVLFGFAKASLNTTAPSGWLATGYLSNQIAHRISLSSRGSYSGFTHDFTSDSSAAIAAFLIVNSRDGGFNAGTVTSNFNGNLVTTDVSNATFQAGLNSSNIVGRLATPSASAAFDHLLTTMSASGIIPASSVGGSQYDSQAAFTTTLSGLVTSFTAGAAVTPITSALTVSSYDPITEVTVKETFLKGSLSAQSDSSISAIRIKKASSSLSSDADIGGSLKVICAVSSKNLEEISSISALMRREIGLSADSISNATTSFQQKRNREVSASSSAYSSSAASLEKAIPIASALSEDSQATSKTSISASTRSLLSATADGVINTRVAGMLLAVPFTTTGVLARLTASVAAQSVNAVSAGTMVASTSDDVEIAVEIQSSAESSSEARRSRGLTSSVSSSSVLSSDSARLRFNAVTLSAATSATTPLQRGIRLERLLTSESEFNASAAAVGALKAQCSSTSAVNTSIRVSGLMLAVPFTVSSFSASLRSAVPIKTAVAAVSSLNPVELQSQGDVKLALTASSNSQLRLVKSVKAFTDFSGSSHVASNYNRLRPLDSHQSTDTSANAALMRFVTAKTFASSSSELSGDTKVSVQMSASIQGTGQVNAQLRVEGMLLAIPYTSAKLAANLTSSVPMSAVSVASSSATSSVNVFGALMADLTGSTTADNTLSSVSDLKSYVVASANFTALESKSRGVQLSFAATGSATVSAPVQAQLKSSIAANTGASGTIDTKKLTDLNLTATSSMVYKLDTKVGTKFSGSGSSSLPPINSKVNSPLSTNLTGSGNFEVRPQIKSEFRTLLEGSSNISTAFEGRTNLYLNVGSSSGASTFPDRERGIPFSGLSLSVASVKASRAMTATGMLSATAGQSIQIGKLFEALVSMSSVSLAYPAYTRLRGVASEAAAESGVTASQNVLRRLLTVAFGTTNLSAAPFVTNVTYNTITADLVYIPSMPTLAFSIKPIDSLLKGGDHRTVLNFKQTQAELASKPIIPTLRYIED